MPGSSFTFNSKALFLVKLGALIVLIAALDAAIGTALQVLFFRQFDGEDSLATYALEKTRADIIVLGDSRANHHYVPDVISKKLGMTCYNTGRDGQSILYSRAVQKAILKRYRPQAMIIDITPNELIYTAQSYARLSELLPYYKKHPEIRDVVLMKSRHERLKLISHIYPYNSKLLEIIRYNLGKSQHIKAYSGYIPRYGVIKDVQVHDEPLGNVSIDNACAAAFERMISDTLGAGIPLYVIISPVYSAYADVEESYTVIKQIARKHNVPFWDYSGDRRFYGKPHLFSDRSHLNHEGATIFSAMVSDRILEDLRQRRNPRAITVHP